MKIAQLAPLWKEVPPLKYGGSELMVANLTDGLVAEDHEVTLFACGGSKTAGKLVEVIDRPMYDLRGGFAWDGIQGYEFLAYYELFKRMNEFDIIHNHMGFHPLVFSQVLSCPIVTTNHSSVKPDFPYLAEKVKDTPFVSISDAQRSVVPYLHYEATVHHGIKVSMFEYNEKPKDYFLFIGSLTKNKGVDIVVKAARDLGLKLILAGEVRKEDQEFLEEYVYPFIDGKNITFVGEVSHTQKNELFKNAKALLFPIQWNEAFGLVMAESLACGTPIIAYNRGSVPEIIKDGVTGFVVEDYQGFLSAVRKVETLSRSACRKDAEERFDVSIMTKNYIKVYESLINRYS